MSQEVEVDHQLVDPVRKANDEFQNALINHTHNSHPNYTFTTTRTRLVSDEETILEVNNSVARQETEHDVIDIQITAPATSAADFNAEEMEDETDTVPTNAFIRGYAVSRRAEATTSTSTLSRLSTAIRRSLRLGPKRTTTAHEERRQPSSTKVSEAKQRSLTRGVTKGHVPSEAEKFSGAPFSQFTNLRREPCGRAFGTLEDLRYNLQMNRIVQVKKFVRHNDWPVSHEIRADLWRVLCHNKDFDSNKMLYTRQLEDLTKSGVKTFRPLFLSMDGMVVHDHGLREEGAVTLQRLLIVIECVRPEIRYVPILYPLCAMFLHYMSAEETFACVIRLLSQGHTFVLQSELSVYASCHTLLSLVKKHKKSVYTTLKRCAGTSDDNKLAEVFLHWNAWIFKFMPFEYLVRVIDCFLVEGHKMLLRVALSLIYIWYKERSRSPIGGALASSPAMMVNANGPTTTNSATPANSTTRFPLLRSSTLPGQRAAKLSSVGANFGGGDAAAKLASTVDQNIADINEQIIAIAQNCPISVQTLLDMGWAIRNFKHSTFEQRQRHYENKFRDQVARIRSEKSNARPLRSIYTAAFESKIIDTEAASEVMAALPSRFQLETPQLLFRLSEHGASFVQLWTQIDEAEQSLLLIRTTIGEVFGAYCSSCWGERRDVRERAKTRYFGTGESFVWKLQPEIHLPAIYQWAGKNSDHPDSAPQMFMTAGDRFLIIGSGGGGDAIAIRDELTSGLSYACDTFDSPALTTGNAFEIDELEVFQVVGTGGGGD